METYKNKSTIYGYLIETVVYRPSRDSICNIFDEDKYLAVARCTVNNQILTLCHSIGRPTSEYLPEFGNAVELALDRAVTKYKIMLEIDPHYKLHDDHPLRNNLQNV